MKKRRDTTAKPRRGVPVGGLVPMSHGGALRNGGTNRGGPGRPPEAIRARSRDQYDRILSEIESRNLKTASLGELATLANTAARYGLGAAESDRADGTGAQVRTLLILPAEKLPRPGITTVHAELLDAERPDGHG